MNREQKAAAVAEIAEQIQGSEAVFAVDYRGITVAQIGDLRARLRESDATFRVVKNTLTERAADKADAAALKALLEGPTALTFVRGDAAASAKVIADYQRVAGGDLLAFKGGLLNGAALDADQITAISKLPTRQVLYGQLVGIVASPITGLARSLNGLVSGLAIALGGVLEKKESGEIGAGGTESAAPEPAAEAAPEADAAEAPAEDTTTTDQDAEAPEPAASSEEPAEGSDDTTETQED
ncbi:50S ribosomal protein L10 [Baekduia soli]|uniref:Large ribosomal subunit protein uL10 n=1 Tax=Baekduia soli TaxID=496014 RepID=A0A5B8UBD9_9ACTN|nr:50S ribosomal protein L10 [Baekduia soli]QEC50314.1 50S ribosomal protein L10 [Baekduia soli]